MTCPLTPYRTYDCDHCGDTIELPQEGSFADRVRGAVRTLEMHSQVCDGLAIVAGAEAVLKEAVS